MKYLTVDFGSTYTKLTAVNGTGVIGTVCSFTTIETNILDGFNAAYKKINFKYDKLLCCSSAGGGLKMVALGLVPELTAKAARMAASNAGAKVVKTYSYEISTAEQQEIYDINPDLLLLCGGTDGGNKETVINNAKLLCEINRNFAIIYAGNKSAARQAEKILSAGNKEYVITQNVMPDFNKINILPAQNAIRDLFIKNIISAKGLDNAQALSSREIIPTPLAVMKACELYSGEIGDFIAVDLGGATTDIYSFCKGEPALENIIPKGLPEPYAKRTVEGDLGMRYSLRPLFEQCDLPQAAAWVEKCVQSPSIIAEPGTPECGLEEALARNAVSISVKRHAGVLEKTYTPLGEFFTLNGKDLSRVQYVLGTGGVIVNSASPSYILAGAAHDSKNALYMLPHSPKYLLDKKYILSAAGLISTENKDLALKIMKEEIHGTEQ
jgi:uncharacterized protein (TIGR01319 family)